MFPEGRVERWAAESWAEVGAAAAAGLLDEGFWTELKQDVPAPSPGANLELAKDVASLALEGGLLIVGITDVDSKAGDVVGVLGAVGLAQRITQVAASRIHPPLALRPVVILDPADETSQRGCVLVPVARSADGPHMVDGRYWGRGPHGKRTLADPEVRRHLQERQAALAEADMLLSRWVETRWLAPPNKGIGTLFVVAAPVAARSDLFAELLYRSDSSLYELVNEAADATRPLGGIHWPISRALSFRSRGNRSECFTSWATEEPAEAGEQFTAIQIGENGQTDLAQGHVTRNGDDEQRMASVGFIAEVLEQTLRLVAAIGDKAGFQGHWQVAVLVTETTGTADSTLRQRGGVRGAVWHEDTYTEASILTQENLTDDVAAAVRRLVLPLARALRAERQNASSPARTEKSVTTLPWPNATDRPYPAAVAKDFAPTGLPRRGCDALRIAPDNATDHRTPSLQHRQGPPRACCPSPSFGCTVGSRDARTHRPTRARIRSVTVRKNIRKD